MRRIKPITIKYKYSSEIFFSILLGFIWTNSTLVSYLRAVLFRIPYINDFRDYIMSGIFIVLICLALPYIAKRIEPILIMIYLSIIVIYIFNLLIFTNNEVALEENLVDFLFKSLPLIFIGSTLDLKKHYHLLYYLSFISVLVRFVHLLLEPVNMINGDMNSSYQLLPHVCMIISSTLLNANFFTIATSILGTIIILSYGSRGPILCIVALILLHLIFVKRMHKHSMVYVFFIGLIIAIACFYEEILNYMLLIVQSMGMSTRIIDMLLYGEIFYSSGRDAIRIALLDAINRNWFGYGIAGDRAIVGTYAHNILIELWVSFGIFWGSLIFIVPTILTVKVLIKKYKHSVLEDSFILVLIASNVKLLLSGSYLTEAFLFLLIGIIFVEHKRDKSLMNKNRADNLYIKEEDC